MGRGTSFSSPARGDGRGEEPDPLGKGGICGIGTGTGGGSAGGAARGCPGRAAPLPFPACFPPFQPRVALSVGRPPSRLPPVHAAGQSGHGAARRLARLPSQSPLRLGGSSCRLFAFLHGFQVKSSGVLFPWLRGASPAARDVPEGSLCSPLAFGPALPPPRPSLISSSD